MSSGSWGEKAFDYLNSYPDEATLVSTLFSVEYSASLLRDAPAQL